MMSTARNIKTGHAPKRRKLPPIIQLKNINKESTTFVSFLNEATCGRNSIEILLGTDVSILQFGLMLRFSSIINS